MDEAGTNFEEDLDMPGSTNPTASERAEPDWLDDRPFYDLMQAYRHSPISQQEDVSKAFEAVKGLIREHLTTHAEAAVKEAELRTWEEAAEYAKLKAMPLNPDIDDHELGWNQALEACYEEFRRRAQEGA